MNRRFRGIGELHACGHSDIHNFNLTELYLFILFKLLSIQIHLKRNYI